MGRQLEDREVGSERVVLTLFPDLEGDRRRDILMAATELFAKKGYKHTSVRDIAESVGLLGGSLYHHIKSKEDLFVEVHGEALRVAGQRVREAVLAERDPWEKLRAACTMQLKIQLDPESVTLPLMDLASVSPKLRERLVAQRDAFEQIYREVVKDLPLDPEIDRNLYRLTLLTLLNGIGAWYQPGTQSPNDVAEQIFRLYRRAAI